MSISEQPTMTINKRSDKEWRLKNGKYHRKDGPAIEYADGTKFWFLNDKEHREGGPAVEFASGDKYWYLNGKLHREDGPAYESAYGDKYWFLNDKELTEDQFLDWKFIQWCTTPVEYIG